MNGTHDQYNGYDNNSEGDMRDDDHWQTHAHINSQDVEELIGEAIEEGERINSELTLTELPHACDVWYLGKNMAFKPTSSVRIASLNIGKAVSTGAWSNSFPAGIAKLMLDHDINILCLQELHLCRVGSDLCYSVVVAFARVSLQILYSTPSSGSHAGVAIIVPSHWPCPAHFCPGSGADGRCIAAIVTCAPGANQESPEQIGVLSVYGHTGATMASQRTAMLGVVRKLKQQVNECEAWFASQSCQSSVVCTDANQILDTDVDCVPANAPQYTRCDEGFLAALLGEEAYVDAIRCSVPANSPILTFSHEWRLSSSNKNICPDAGSCLDRILARDVSILRSGGLAPGFCTPYLSKSPDHALLVADLHMVPIASAESESTYDPRSTNGPLVRAFLREAVAASQNNIEGPNATFLDMLSERLAGDQNMLDTLDRITTAANNILSNPPTTSHMFATYEAQLGEHVATFLNDVYFPIIRLACRTPAASSARTEADGSHVQHLTHKIKVASSLWPGATPNFASDPGKFFADDRAPLSVGEIIEAIKTAWEELCGALPAELHPTELRELLQQCAQAGPNPSTEVLNGIKRTSFRASGRLQFKVRAAAALKRTEDVTDLYRHDIAGFFRRTVLKASHPPTIPKYAFQVDPALCAVPPASQADCMAEATRQHWCKLYGTDPWHLPSLIEPSRSNISGYETGSLLEEIDDHELSAEEKLLLDAMRRCRSDVVDWEQVMLPISADEFAHMCNARWGRAAGISGMKMCAVQFLPNQIKTALLQLLQCMWTHQMVPVLLKTTLLALLEKPGGGQRGISLMEEMLKALDSLLTERIKASIHLGCTIDDLLSPLNKAYKPGRSISDIIHAHALTLEDAVIRKQPLVCAMTDLSKFYDTIQLVVIDVVLKLKGCTAKVISMIRAMYAGAMMRVLTHYCLTEPFARLRGLHQGSPLSCFLCLVFLEPYLRALEALPRDTAYLLEGAVAAQDSMYSDDATKISNSLEGMQARLNVTDPILALCGMGQDKDKAMVVSANIDLSRGPHHLSVLSYNRSSGSLERFNVPVLDIADQRAKYRLLGAHFWKGFLRHDKSKDALRDLQRRVARIRYFHLPVRPTCTLLTACVLSKAADATVLMSPLTPRELSRIDSLIGRSYQEASLLPPNTPRAWAFAASSAGGQGAWSATAWFLHATLRETLILLNTPSYLGALARKSYYRLRSTELPEREQCMLHRAVSLLASYGYFIHSSDELLHCRGLALLRLYNNVTCANLIERNELQNRASHLQWAPLSPSALALRDMVHILQRVAPHLKSAHVVPSLADVEAAVAMAGAQLNPETVAQLMECLPALTTARDAGNRDWLVYCRATLTDPRDPNCPSEEMSYEDSRYGDQRIQYLKAPLHVPTSLRGLDRGTTETFVSASDGGTRGAAIVVVRTPTPPSAHQHPLAVFNCVDPPSEDDVLFRLFTTLPPLIGNDASNSYPCESVANHLDLRLRLAIPLGPAFIDNQSVLDRICAAPMADTRALIKQGRPNIHHTLFALQQELRVSPLYRSAQPSEQFRTMAETWQPAARTFTSAPSIGPFTKVKSHQQLPCGDPCYIATFVNDLADKLVNVAERDQPHHPPVQIPPARGRFFAMDSGGRMVTTTLRTPVMQKLQSDALTHWSCRSARRIKGLATSLLRHIHPAAPAFHKYPIAEAPFPDVGVTVTRSLLTKHYLRIGGSWSSFLYLSPDRIPGVQAAYLEAYPELVEARSEQDLHNLCPYCLYHGSAAIGDGHHYRSGSCCDEQVQNEREKVLVAVETCLTTIATPERWISQLKTLPQADSRTPILSAAKWMVQADVEATGLLDTATIDEEIRATDGLGWRAGTTPLRLRYSTQPLSLAEIHTIEVTKVVLLEQYSSFLADKFREAYYTLTGPEESPPVSLSPPSQDGEPITFTRCTQPGCTAAAHNQQFVLCPAHAHKHRMEEIRKEIQRRLLAQDVITPILTEALFTRPRTLTQFEKGLFRSCQLQLTGTKRIGRVREMTPEQCIELCQLTLLPYKSEATGPIVWNGGSIEDTLCECKGTINATDQKNLTERTAFTCRLCGGLRVVVPSTLQSTNCGICANCGQHTSVPEDRECHGCRLGLHFHREHCAPNYCPGVPPSDHLWHCPQCQLCITAAFARRSLNKFPLPKLLKLLPTSASSQPTEHRRRHRKRRRGEVHSSSTTHALHNPAATADREDSYHSEGEPTPSPSLQDIDGNAAEYAARMGSIESR